MPVRPRAFDGREQTRKSSHDTAQLLRTKTALQFQIDTAICRYPRRWLRGAFHGVTPKHRQRYLDEFAFRVGWRWRATGWQSTE
jgi:hypothetical protein